MTSVYATDPERSLVPLFLERRDEPQQFLQIGTGIFVEFQAAPFLFTAAHVTDSLKSGELVAPIPGGFARVEGYLGYVDTLPGQTRDEDSVDVAYYRLSSRFGRALCAHFQPLPQTRCRLLTTSLNLVACSVLGFPVSRARAFGAHRTSETASYRGVAADHGAYDRMGLSPLDSVVIRFHRDRALSTDGKRTNPIGMRGVSGGGIFSWPNGHELSQDWTLPDLVGIFHTYKSAEGLMIGSTLAPVLAAIQLGDLKGFCGIR